MCECGERGGRGGMGDHGMSNRSMCGCMCVWWEGSSRERR